MAGSGPAVRRNPCAGVIYVRKRPPQTPGNHQKTLKYLNINLKKSSSDVLVVGFRIHTGEKHPAQMVEWKD